MDRNYDRDYDRSRRYGRRDYDDGNYSGEYHPEERGFFERTGDEVRSWFGDEEAEHRREMDERMYERERSYGERGYGDRDYDRDYGNRGYSDRSYGPGDTYRSDYDRARQYARSGREDDEQEGWFGSRGRQQRRWREGGRKTESWAVPGPHAGKGPQGYKRSHDRIREDVCERLTHHGHLDASKIEVSVDNQEVTLKGIVDSRRAKRMAEDIAESVSGVRDVHNQLRISEWSQEETVQHTQAEQETETPMGANARQAAKTKQGTAKAQQNAGRRQGTKSKQGTLKEKNLVSNQEQQTDGDKGR